jgi:hypothetical protein
MIQFFTQFLHEMSLVLFYQSECKGLICMTVDKETLYFGCEDGCLDINTLQYRWFGAVWKLQGSVKIVCGYWFGNSESDVRNQARIYGSLQNVSTEHLQDVYSSIRKIQNEKDWKQRSRLPFFSLFTSPWKGVDSGWYIIRSRETYPFYVSAIRKKRFSVWLEHVSICENRQNFDEFVAKVNREHDIQLKIVSRKVTRG